MIIKKYFFPLFCNSNWESKKLVNHGLKIFIFPLVPKISKEFSKFFLIETLILATPPHLKKIDLR